MALFPARAFVQTFRGAYPPDYEPVVEHLRSMKVPVIALDDIAAGAPRLTRSDFVVGDFGWTRYALSRLNICMPSPPDYPACLQPLLHRRIWQSSLGDVRAMLLRPPAARPEQIFIKPAVRAMLKQHPLRLA
jgi:hypothetical protein